MVALFHVDGEFGIAGDCRQIGPRPAGNRPNGPTNSIRPGMRKILRKNRLLPHPVYRLHDGGMDAAQTSTARHDGRYAGYQKVIRSTAEPAHLLIAMTAVHVRLQLHTF